MSTCNKCKKSASKLVKIKSKNGSKSICADCFSESVQSKSLKVEKVL